MDFPTECREYDYGRAELYGREYGMVYGVREEFDDSVAFRFAHQEGWGDERTYTISPNGTVNRDLMWFTGSHDTKGTKVFGKDICHDEDNTPFVVVYSPEKCAWCRRYADTTMPLQLLAIENRPFEVIGNVFETPELV